MSRIVVKDLPRKEKITREELKRILGGRGDDGYFFKIGSKTIKPPRLGSGPCYDQTFCQ